MSTIFNTNPRGKIAVTRKVIRAAKRIWDGDFQGPRPATLQEAIGIAVGLTAGAGSLSTLALQHILNKMKEYTGNPDHEAGVDSDVDEGMEVEIGSDGTLVNLPDQGETDITALPRDPRTGRKRLRAEMEADAGGEDGGGQIVEAARASGGGGANPVSKETPVTIAPSISYGLPETHTTIIPWNFWFSMAYVGSLASVVPPKLSFRLNSIDDIVITPIGTLAAGALVTNGVFNVPLVGNNARPATNPPVFPRTITNGASTSEQPFWANYWKKIYEYYTVIGTEYKITCNNITPSQQNCSALILYDMDSYSDTVGATGNVTPDAVVAELLSYPRMGKKALVGTSPSLVSQEPYEMIQGRHKPGDISRNISNDGDVKTWTKTDGTLPTLKEIMNIRCAKSPFYTGGTDGHVSVNFQVEIKMIVQFKDLKLAARYPMTGQTPIQPTLPNDVIDVV